MNWILVFLSGLITYFLRYTMISLIKKDMLSEKTKVLLGYVPSAVFPALIFPAVLIENSGSYVNYDDPKIIAILIAMLVGYSPACGRAEMGGAEPGRFTLVMKVDGPRFRPRKSGTPATSQSEPSVSSSSARLVSTGSADDGAGCAAS